MGARKGRKLSRDYDRQSITRMRQGLYQYLPGQIEEPLEVGVGDAQCTRVAPQPVDLYCLAGKTLHRIVLSKDDRVITHKCIILRRLVKVARDALCWRETEEGLKQWVHVFEVQELGQERERVWIRQGDRHDGNLERSFGVCRQRRGWCQDGQIGAIEGEDRLVDRIHHDTTWLRTRWGRRVDGRHMSGRHCR